MEPEKCLKAAGILRKYAKGAPDIVAEKKAAANAVVAKYSRASMPTAHREQRIARKARP